MEVFKALENLEYIYVDDLDLLTNYVCRHLVSDYLPNRSYFYR